MHYMWKESSVMNRDLVGSILVRSSMKNTHLVPIRWQTWPPQTIIVSDWLLSKKLSPLKRLCQMNWNLVGSILGRSSVNIAHLISILGNSCFWLADFFKSSPLKPLCQMNRNLVGSSYDRSSIRIAHLFPIR
jgi:hypothetical protein